MSFDSVWRMCVEVSRHISANTEQLVKYSKNSKVFWLVVEYTLHAAPQWRIALSQGYICSHAATAVAMLTRSPPAESYYADMSNNRKGGKKHTRLDRIVPRQISSDSTFSTMSRYLDKQADLAFRWLCTRAADDILSPTPFLCAMHAVGQHQDFHSEVSNACLLFFLPAEIHIIVNCSVIRRVTLVDVVNHT